VKKTLPTQKQGVETLTRCRNLD